MGLAVQVVDARAVGVCERPASAEAATHLTGLRSLNQVGRGGLLKLALIVPRPSGGLGNPQVNRLKLGEVSHAALRQSGLN
jgi:hypothetical protein